MRNKPLPIFSMNFERSSKLPVDRLKEIRAKLTLCAGKRLQMSEAIRIKDEIELQLRIVQNERPYFRNLALKEYEAIGRQLSVYTGQAPPQPSGFILAMEDRKEKKAKLIAIEQAEAKLKNMKQQLLKK